MNGVFVSTQHVGKERSGHFLPSRVLNYTFHRKQHEKRSKVLAAGRL